MYEYLNENNLLAKEQFGFRKNHSTEYAALSLVDHISKQMEHGKRLEHCILIYLKLLIHYRLI